MSSNPRGSGRLLLHSLLWAAKGNQILPLLSARIPSVQDLLAEHCLTALTNHYWICTRLAVTWAILLKLGASTAGLSGNPRCHHANPAAPPESTDALKTLPRASRSFHQLCTWQSAEAERSPADRGPQPGTQRAARPSLLEGSNDCHE